MPCRPHPCTHTPSALHVLPPCRLVLTPSAARHPHYLPRFVQIVRRLKSAWQKEGWGGLFKGNGANCLKVAPSRGTQFLVYEFAKRQMRAASWGIASGGGLHAGARLCAGGLAGMVAAVIVYPLEVVKTLRTVYPKEATGIISAAKAAMKYGGGIAGLYAGVLPTLCMFCTSASSSWCTRR